MNIKKHFCPQNIDIKFGVYKYYWNRDFWLKFWENIYFKWPSMAHILVNRVKQN